MGVKNRTLLAATALGALGFTGVLLVLPGRLVRWVRARVDAVTDEIVAAAAAAWSDPGEVEL